MRKQLLLLFFSLFAVMGFARTVTGVVKQASDKETIIGASVRVHGTTRGVTTDIDGKFQIDVQDGDVLDITYVGMNPVSVKVGKQTVIEVEMTDNSQVLSEVVVTAMGQTQEKKKLNFAVQSLNSDQVTAGSASNFANSLQGKVAGLQVSTGGGSPNSSTQVIIRAISSVNISQNNEPLVIVDGVPVRGLGSSLGDINANDIENMSVLKGAAAAALYGSDASNGAIIITTKKGRNGKARVTYSNQLSWSKAYGWPKIQQKYANGAYGTTNYYYTSQNGAEYDGSIPTYDNAAALLQTGFMHKHNLSVEAGNEKMSVRASASFFDQTGVIKTTDLKRTNLSLAGKAEVAKWLKFEGSIQYVNQKNHKALRGLNGPIRQAYKWLQVDDMSNYMAEDGSHMRYPNYYTDTDHLNPLFGLYKNLNYDVTDRFISAFSVNIVPFEHTFVRAQFGWDVSTSAYEYGSHPYYKSRNQEVNDASNSGVYSLSKYNTNDPTINVLAGYNNDFLDGKFTVGAQLGYHQLENGVSSLSSSGSNFKVIEFYSINNCTESTVKSSKLTTKRRLGASSSSSNNMAFLTGRFRNDWSSTLPTDNNSFFYPAVEASVVLTEIGGLKNLGWMNYLKLRGAIAQVGKDAPALSIDPELEPTNLVGGGYKYGYTGPNKNLKPEMTTSYEIGLEGRFWDDRVNADFTMFRTHCADQIVTGFRMSYATGFVLNNMNVGTFNTWGWEGHVDVDVLKGKDFRWNVGVNLSHTGSEIVELPANLKEYYNAYTWNSGNIRNGVMMGHPITTVTGRGYDRNKNGDILISPTSGLPLTSADWSVLGNREPKLRFGLTTSLSYKNFRLNAMFQGRYHADVVNATIREMTGNGLSEFSVANRESGSHVFKGVLKDGNEDSDHPTINTIAVDFDKVRYAGGDEDWIQHKINYIRCQELRLAYIVPSAWLAKITNNTISNATIYVSGNDLFTITNYTGIDVAGNTMSAAAGGTGGEGYDCWSLPSPRTYTVGLSVTF